MLGGSQCNVLHCVLRRNLYVDLQLCVSKKPFEKPKYFLLFIIIWCCNKSFVI